MEQYLDLIKHTLQNGSLEENRTDEYTLSTFGYNYTIDLSRGYPLLTTKQMDNFRWDSMLHELEWYMSGKHHVRDLTKKTGIWDAWADENMNLPSAYGRFWRRYPVPHMPAQLSGESWLDESSDWTEIEKTVTLRYVYGSNEEEVVKKSMNQLSSILSTLVRDVNTYIGSPTVGSNRTNQSVEISVTVSHQDSELVAGSIKDIRDKSSAYDSEVSESVLTFDQVQFIVDALNGDNPHRGPESRRLVLNAWHPANAQSSDLPPCHFSSVFNVQSGKLNTHLTQRSADIALGVPFNIAAYSALNRLIAQQTGYEPGYFNHTLVDAHIYCGKAERSRWYRDNIDELQKRVQSAEKGAEYRDIRDMIIEETSQDTGVTKPSEHNYGHDHIPGLLEQVSRETLGRCRLNIDEGTTVNNVSYDDFELEDYESHKGIRFTVAE
jgi:thymidylate synthase